MPSFTGSGASTDQAAKAMRRAGRLVAAPTTVSGSFPYGGTSLGLLARGAELVPEEQFARLRCLNDRGREPFDYLYRGHGEVIFEAELSQHNDDTVQVAFPGQTAAGATRRHIQSPGGLAMGALGSSEAIKLAFIPENIANHDAVLMRSAVPGLAPAARILWRVARQGSLVVWLRVLRDAAAADAEERFVVGKWADLTI